MWLNTSQARKHMTYIKHLLAWYLALRVYMPQGLGPK